MSLRRNWIICSLLLAATLAVYGQAIRFEFVLFDDDSYVTGNPDIQKGLTAQAIRHYREALRLAPHSGRARHNLVNALVTKGEIDEAIVQLRESLELAPDLGRPSPGGRVSFPRRGAR